METHLPKCDVGDRPRLTTHPAFTRATGASQHVWTLLCSVLSACTGRVLYSVAQHGNEKGSLANIEWKEREYKVIFNEFIHLSSFLSLLVVKGPPRTGTGVVSAPPQCWCTAPLSHWLIVSITASLLSS